MDEESFINLLGVDYKREGGLFKICCPFHHDTHPSLVVYPQDRGYCCYPCARTGSWQELYKEIKGCDWREAYDILGIDGEYHTEQKPHIRFEFVDTEDNKFIDAISRRFEQCLPLTDPVAESACNFLKRKGLLEQAKELDWRWDKGLFKQSKPYGALVIPYREGGKVVSCRLRAMKEDRTFTKPLTLKGTHARPFVLTRESDTLYICEGETDALSLYASGCSVVAVPGAGQRKCINTAVLYAELTKAKRIVSCGDNDGPGRMMNELVKKATHSLTTCQFDTLKPEEIGNMNDINDAFVAGKLNLGLNAFFSIFPGATPLAGWDGVYAKSLFSTNEKTYDLIADEMESLEGPEADFAADLFSAPNLASLKEAWAKGSVEMQTKFVYMKEALKNILTPPTLKQSSMLGNSKNGA